MPPESAPAVIPTTISPQPAPKPSLGIAPKPGDVTTVRSKGGEKFTMGEDGRVVGPRGAKPAIRSTQPATLPAPVVETPAAPETATDPGPEPKPGEAPPPEPKKPEAPEDPTKAPTVDDAELARRLSVLNRAEHKFTKEKQQHAGRLEIANVMETALGKDNFNKQNVTRVLEQVAMMTRGREIAAKDPLGFLERVFGVDRRQAAGLVIDWASGQQARKPEEKQSEDLAARDARIDALEKQVKEGAEQQAREKFAARTQEYISTTIEPLFADVKSYPHIRALCDMHGSSPARELYNAMAERYTKTRTAPDPKVLAQEIEQDLKSRFEKSLGRTNANPAEEASQTRSGAPQAKPAPRRVTTADPPVTQRRKLVTKPYSRTPV